MYLHCFGGQTDDFRKSLHPNSAHHVDIRSDRNGVTVTRRETRKLIARQIAVFNGHNPNIVLNEARAPASTFNGYMTLAENILACVERGMCGHSDLIEREISISD